ncbi:molybdopterin molybdotransferase MoeA [Diaphorobacter aerolatus]|uniref:Molybdopterin molybdenumtransferase n=1 Tax=Diaphorobacter aerolatus TaxID=1288495 RepID=A0A7H0GLM3_9BURK|nr:gephyrin-like molybdotransferase Glp [Diaphorobacter aerolatus]QNP49189.1 molybdopterin molybdotransferase MoeA [Diaphorobacter aerolatus]
MTSLESIASNIAHYDEDDMHVDAVHGFLARMITPITQCETVPLIDALGRVLAADVISAVNVPPHDNSAMDGFAFHGSSLQGGRPLHLKPIATALAGHAWSGHVAADECVRIMTGAVMPAGLDTVVPIERTTQAADGSIEIAADGLRPGANRRLKGEDLMQGGIALAAGELVTPAALGLLASLGLSQVSVTRRLRVAYFSTGDEILGPGDAPREGAVYDSNRFSLFGLLMRLGVEVIDLGTVRDEPQRIEATFFKAAASADAVITSGGVSGGDADHIRAMMKRLGDVAFWRIAMRPGRPMAVGWLNRQDCADDGRRCVLFGLPGNPVAAMVTFLALVRPALLAMMGCKRAAPPRLQAVCTETLRKRPGRTEFQRGIVTQAASGALEVCTTGSQGSGMLSSMVHANGLIVLPHDTASIHPGDTVEVMMFEGMI